MRDPPRVLAGLYYVSPQPQCFLPCIGATGAGRDTHGSREEGGTGPRSPRDKGLKGSETETVFIILMMDENETLIESEKDEYDQQPTRQCPRWSPIQVLTEPDVA